MYGWIKTRLLGMHIINVCGNIALKMLNRLTYVCCVVGCQEDVRYGLLWDFTGRYYWCWYATQPTQHAASSLSGDPQRKVGSPLSRHLWTSYSKYICCFTSMYTFNSQRFQIYLFFQWFQICSRSVVFFDT